MAKKTITECKFEIVDKLLDIERGTPVSRYLMNKLHGEGYLEMVESRNPGQRGQTTKTFAVSGKGRGYIALAKNWKRS